MSKARALSRLISVCGILVAVVASAAEAPEGADLSKRETAVLQQICLPCHGRPGIGVPLIGDEAEWQVRRTKGLEALVAATIEGSLGMPPLGTCSFCTETELRRLVALLAGFSGGAVR